MTLNDALSCAVTDSFDHTNDEESGGMIMKHRDKEDYLWASLLNDMEGMYIARTLFVPNEHEYADKVLSRLKDRYRPYASFHTHPVFPSYPSHTDVTRLFPNHNVNFIFSMVHGEIAKYTWLPGKKLLREKINLCQPKLELQAQAESVAG